MDRNSVKIYREKKKEGLDRRESVEKLSSLKKRSFSGREKRIEMNVTSKLLKHRSNQHIKLSKRLSTYKQSIQDPKHTHTHTQNKSNQFYISKTILTHVFLVMVKSHCTYTCIKSSKEFAYCV